MRCGIELLQRLTRRVEICLMHPESLAIESAAIFGSGRDFGRPQLLALLKALREGDELIVWRLCRIWRSTKDLLSTVYQLAARGAGFASLTERIVTSSATGKLMLTVFSAMAAFERDLVAEKNQGRAGCRSNPGSKGRPPAEPQRRGPSARSHHAGRPDHFSY